MLVVYFCCLKLEGKKTVFYLLATLFSSNKSILLMFFLPTYVHNRPEDWSALPIAMVAMFTVFVAATTMDFGRPDVVPFTMDEWVWAAKGGYLPTMVSHFFHNGGL